MTQEQVSKLLQMAQERINENLAKCKMVTGNGVNSYQSGTNQVIFLDDDIQPRRITETQRVPESIVIEGFAELVTVGQIDYPPPAEPITIDERYTTADGVQLTAVDGQIITNLLVDRLAFYQTQTPPASGFVSFRQTLYLRVKNYSFPVRLTFSSTVIPTDGEPSTSTFTVDFNSSSQQNVDVIQTFDGRKLVSAIAVERQ